MIGRSIVPPARDHTHIQTVEMKQESALSPTAHFPAPCHALARWQGKQQNKPCGGHNGYLCALANVRADIQAQTRGPPPTAWPIQPPCAVSKRRAPAPEARVLPGSRHGRDLRSGSQERAKTPDAAVGLDPRHTLGNTIPNLAPALGIVVENDAVVVSARPGFRSRNKTPLVYLRY